MDVREKLVELIASKECDYYSGVYETWVEHDCEKCGAENCSVAQLADHLIANGVTLDNQVSKWISVKDRLPEKDVKVLTFGVYGFSVNYRDRFSGKWRGVNGKSQWITHWMPLPQPPKGE